MVCIPCMYNWLFCCWIFKLFALFLNQIILEWASVFVYKWLFLQIEFLEVIFTKVKGLSISRFFVNIPHCSLVMWGQFIPHQQCLILSQLLSAIIISLMLAIWMSKEQNRLICCNISEVIFFSDVYSTEVFSFLYSQLTFFSNKFFPRQECSSSTYILVNLEHHVLNGFFFFKKSMY